MSDEIKIESQFLRKFIIVSIAIQTATFLTLTIRIIMNVMAGK